MSKRIMQIGFLLLVAALTLWSGPSALAQRRLPPPRIQRQRPLPPNRPALERRMLDLPPRWAQQLQNMTPEEQERFFANDSRFRGLPPARQEQIRRRLQVWNSLSHEQQQAILDREQVWVQMTPAQQAYVRNTLFPQWRNMRPIRRQAILGRLRDLRDLDDSQRAARLNDESFLAGLDPGERQMLRDLAGLRVAEPEPPGF
jgi:hypothetical protein